MTRIKQFFYLTKPGIIMGNAITATAGFMLASQGKASVGLYLAMLAGLSLIIASACVFNNYIDRGIDKKMTRTKNRALVSGMISGAHAIIYGTFLGLSGLLILLRYTNALTAGVAVFGFFSYVVLYGIWKRRSAYGTLVGSVSGAVPPVVGYSAVSNRLDMGALLLFIILVLWQMPHFYAIAIYRVKDYKSALVPVLPAKKGIARTKLSMVFYVAAFTLAASILSVFGFTGIAYLVVVGLLGVSWLRMGMRGFNTNNDEAWARGMFRFSLIVITGFSAMIVIDSLF
ncbi:heme o synthase [soil metagenome]